MKSMTIENIINGYKSKEFLPSEITKEIFNKIKKTDKKFNSYISLFEEAAINRSIMLDKDISKNDYPSLVYGVPISLKDIFLVKDELCTCGSKMLSNYISNYNSTVYESLETAGAILLGKINLIHSEVSSDTVKINSAFLYDSNNFP